jgi:hypothetical protein
MLSSKARILCTEDDADVCKSRDQGWFLRVSKIPALIAQLQQSSCTGRTTSLLIDENEEPSKAIFD